MKLSQFSELHRHQNSIKEISKDDSDKKNGNVYYMSDDARMAIDFDQVKEEYLSKNNLDVHYAKSVDAVFQDDNEKLFFVEFKHGKFEPSDISKKAIDSVMICGDIIKKTLSYFRKESEFFLVVSDDTFYKLNPQDKRALGLARRSHKDISFWGLSKLRGYCFENVDAKSKSQFEKWIVSKQLI